MTKTFGNDLSDLDKLRAQESAEISFCRITLTFLMGEVARLQGDDRKAIAFLQQQELGLRTVLAGIRKGDTEYGREFEKRFDECISSLFSSINIGKNKI